MTKRIVRSFALLPDAFLTFNLNAKGEIAELRMMSVNDLADFSFDYQDLLFTPVKAQQQAASGSQ